MSTMCKVSVEHEGFCARVSPEGNLVAVSIQDFKNTLKELIDKGVTTLVIDLSQCSIIDSLGLGLLIATRNSILKLNGSISIINVSPDLTELFSQTGLSGLFGIVSAS